MWRGINFGGALDGGRDWMAERHFDVVLDVHHYDELCADVDRHRDRFLALWSRIGERYAGADPRCPSSCSTSRTSR